MSRGHTIVKNFLQKRGAWDYKPSTSSVTKTTTPVTGHAFNEADVKVVQPAYNPRPGETIVGSTNGVEDMNSKAQYVANGAVMQKNKKQNTNKLGKNIGEAVVTTKSNKDASTEINKLGHQAGKGIRAGANIIDKSGAIHSPMSRARHLARQGLAQMLKINPKIAESWDDRTLAELKKSTLASYIPKAAQAAAQNVYTGKEAQAWAGHHMRAGDYKASDAQLATSKKELGKSVRRLKGIETATKKLAKEAVNIPGIGTDIVDKKKVLNPPIPLTQKPKQVKDFKEEALIEGKMKDIYTDMMDHATKKGYASHKEFTPADYETVGRLHGISGKELAVLAGHKTAAQVAKEETVNELKASTLQSYADKAHQQAMDATYDAAHLNRTGEEKLKADAKRLAAKRAAGVQQAQTKLDKMGEALEWPHSAGDVVRCKRTQRLASVQSVENDQYTVVYADGSTETGPADWWTQVDPVNEARIVEKPRGWNVKHLKPAGHGIVGKKVRSYDFPGMHDSHYIEGHVTDEDPHSYHIRTTKVVRHDKEEPIPAHLTHIRAPKGMSLFGGAPGVYYAPREQKPAAKPSMRSLRGKK